ncbi:MAG: MFS transporter [Candidatus Aquirickettsiella sp.]
MDATKHFNVLSKLFLIVFICFFSFGATITIIPIYIKTELGFSSFIVGVTIALQYVSMIFSRSFSGKVADVIGAKIAVLCGLLAAFICGLAYFGCVITKYPLIKLSFIAIGRTLLGISESLIVTGVLTWALNQVGSSHAGKVMAWNGNAMYGGVALGALGGGWLAKWGGFPWIVYAAIFFPIIAWLIAQTLERQKLVEQKQRLPFMQVIKMVLLPGISLLLSTVGYSVILSFSGLFFQERHWIGAEIVIACFGISFVLARILFSGMPDRFGGARISIFSLMIECTGLGLMFIANNQNLVFLGSALSGFGFSLVVPSLGVEALKQIPVQNRGTAMGTFLAFFDLSFCIAVPFAGLMTHSQNYQIVYLIGASCSFLALLISLKLISGYILQKIITS